MIIMNRKGLINNSNLFILVCLFISGLVSGCRNGGNGIDNVDEISPESYPISDPTQIDESEASYPIEEDSVAIEESGYPPIDTPLPPSIANPYPDPIDENAVLFALNKPIRPGDTNVSGVGPAGLTVELVNTTGMGESLGITSINEDGKFSLQVNPLPQNIRIGLQADISMLGLTEQDIRPGDESRNIPLVGYFFDTALVINE